jgi:serine/threonine-protein kinase
MSVPDSERASCPERLGAFKLERVLGEGGSGTVYAARWGHRSVALKVLRKSLLTSEAERSRFLDEARKLSDVTHAGVVKVMGFGKLDDGRPYLVMERLEGEVLSDRLRQGPMELELALSIFDQIVSAVSTLHEQGLIHRDIKAENIFLVEGGEYAVLLDFGIAKQEGEPMSTVTREGGVRGTPAYMAPERFFGNAANVRTDIYELAVVLYAMVTGRLPWEDAADPVGRLNPVRPSDIGVKLPGNLETEILQALSTRAETRPESVAELGRKVREAAAACGIRIRRRTADMAVTTERITREVSATGPTAEMDAVSYRAVVESTSDAGSGPAVPHAVTGPAPGPAGARTTDPVTGRSVATAEAGRGEGASKPAGSADLWKRVVAAAVFGVAFGLAVVAAVVYWPGDEEATDGRAVGEQVPKSRPGRPGDEPSGDTSGSISPGGAGEEIDAGKDPRQVLALHPSDSQLTFWVSFDELKRSAVYEEATRGLDVTQLQLAIGMLQAMCGIDLGKQLRWVSFSVAGKKDVESVTMAVNGRWTRAEIENCIKSLGSMNDTKIELEKTGKVTRTNLGGRDLLLGWPDTNTVLFTNRRGADVKWMTERVSAKGSSLQSAEIRELSRKLDGDKTAWLVSLSPTWMAKKYLKGDLKRPEGVFGMMHLREEIDVKIGLHYESPKEAEQARKGVEQSIDRIRKEQPAVSSVFSGVRVETDGDVVVARVSMGRQASAIVGKAVRETIEQVSKSVGEQSAK